MKNTGVFCLIAFLATISAKPIEEEGLVQVSSDNEGHYKYSFTSKNITIVEEKITDETVKGFYSYIDDFGIRQTVEYVAGIDGFVATGDSIPVSGPAAVADLPDVVEARYLHQKVTEEISKLLPKLKLGEDVVEEQPIVPLSKEEQLAAIEEVLNPKNLAFVEDTPETKQLKEELFKAYANALSK